jgi:hypothetical protein
MRSYKEAWKRNIRGRLHRILAGGDDAQEEFQSPCNVAEERCGGGGVINGDAGRRRASALARSRPTAAELSLCSSGRR